MRRRDIFLSSLHGILISTSAMLGIGVARAAAAPDPARPKVAYHLCDADKVSSVLGNIKNHFAARPTADIVLVVHGPALPVFRLSGQGASLSPRWEQLRHAGLTAFACGHALHGFDISLADLLPGFAVADEGGVVKLAELQTQGYAYLRP